jgi:hypothetical protein
MIIHPNDLLNDLFNFKFNLITINIIYIFKNPQNVSNRQGLS